MRHQRNIIEHGPRRLWLRPWKVVCRCGLGAYPCPVVRMRDEQAEMIQTLNNRWNVQTGQYRVAPLLTRGQAARTWPGDRR
jgi:hypothetical protein